MQNKIKINKAFLTILESKNKFKGCTEATKQLEKRMHKLYTKKVKYKINKLTIKQ